MSRVKSLVFAGLGAAALSYGAYEYSTRFSDQNIWNKLQPRIERTFRMDARGGRDRQLRADERRTERLDSLRGGISRLGNSSMEERCRFVKEFSSGLLSSAPETLAEARRQETYAPGSECTPVEQAKDTTTLALGIGGISLFLIGIAGFIKSFFKGGLGQFGKDAEKKRKEMEKERFDSLLALGLPPADAKSVSMESIRVQSVDDVLCRSHSCSSVLRVLDNYGFSKEEVQKIVLTFPGLLNRSPEQITSKLIDIENCGEKPPEEVRKNILRLPASLG